MRIILILLLPFLLQATTLQFKDSLITVNDIEYDCTVLKVENSFIKLKTNASNKTTISFKQIKHLEIEGYGPVIKNKNLI